MEVADRWIQELKLSDGQIQDLVDKLRPVIAGHHGQAPYDVFENAIKEYGFTKADAQKVMAVLYAKAVFPDTFNAWDYKPFSLLKYIQQLQS